MKKFSILCAILFCTTAHATTVNINWVVDGQNYDSTTCETGNNFILPTTSPTKYGYTFRGWHFDEFVGTVSQSGTPTPTNPIYPTFLPVGNTFLRAIRSGNNSIADSYDPTTGKITRRIGVKVLSESDWFTNNAYNTGKSTFMTNITNSAPLLCSHFSYNTNWNQLLNNQFATRQTAEQVFFKDTRFTTPNDFSAWIADQYNVGTPVTVYYPLDTPVEEIME